MLQCTAWLSATVLVASLATGCKTIKPYEKEYLLHPLMDDGVVGLLDNTAAQVPTGQNERLSATASTSGGSSCPTCGG